MWTEAERRIGIRSAASVGILGTVYVATGLAGVLMRPPGLPMLAQVDPWLAVLEGLIILSAVALVVMMAALCAYAPTGARLHARIAFAFTIAFAVLTCTAHFAALTVGRQAAAEAPALARQLGFDWPTLSLAVDLLAWDMMLGLALLFAAPVFRGDGLHAWVRRTASVAGLLCLIGLIGPLSGEMRFQFAAIAGYAFVTPVVCVLIAVAFARAPAEPAAAQP